MLTLLDFSTFHDAARNASLASGFPDGTGTTSPPVASPPSVVHCCWAARLARNAMPGPQLTAASTVSSARTRPAAIALVRVDTAVTAAWAGRAALPAAALGWLHEVLDPFSGGRGGLHGDHGLGRGGPSRRWWRCCRGGGTWGRWRRR